MAQSEIEQRSIPDQEQGRTQAFIADEGEDLVYRMALESARRAVETTSPGSKEHSEAGTRYYDLVAVRGWEYEVTLKGGKVVGEKVGGQLAPSHWISGTFVDGVLTNAFFRDRAIENKLATSLLDTNRKVLQSVFLPSAPTVPKIPGGK